MDGSNFFYNSYSQSYNNVWTDHPNFCYGWDNHQNYFHDSLQDTQQFPCGPEASSHFNSGTPLDNYIKTCNAGHLQFQQGMQQLQQSMQQLQQNTLQFQQDERQYWQDTWLGVQEVASQQESGNSLEELIKNLTTNNLQFQQSLQQQLQQFQQETSCRLQNVASQMGEMVVRIERLELQMEEEQPHQPEAYLTDVNAETLQSDEEFENFECNTQGIVCVEEVEKELEAEKDTSFSSEVNTEFIIIVENDSLLLPSRLEELNEEEKGEETFEVFPECMDSVEIESLRIGTELNENDYQLRPYPEEPHVEESHVAPEDHNFVT